MLEISWLELIKGTETGRQQGTWWQRQTVRSLSACLSVSFTLTLFFSLSQVSPVCPHWSSGLLSFVHTMQGTALNFATTVKRLIVPEAAETPPYTALAGRTLIPMLKSKGHIYKTARADDVLNLPASFYTFTSWSHAPFWNFDVFYQALSFEPAAQSTFHLASNRVWFQMLLLINKFFAHNLCTKHSQQQ